MATPPLPFSADPEDAYRRLSEAFEPCILPRSRPWVNEALRRSFTPAEAVSLVQRAEEKPRRSVFSYPVWSSQVFLTVRSEDWWHVFRRASLLRVRSGDPVTDEDVRVQALLVRNLSFVYPVTVILATVVVAFALLLVFLRVTGHLALDFVTTEEGLGWLALLGSPLTFAFDRWNLKRRRRVQGTWQDPEAVLSILRSVRVGARPTDLITPEGDPLPLRT